MMSFDTDMTMALTVFTIHYQMTVIIYIMIIFYDHLDRINYGRQILTVIICHFVRIGEIPTVPIQHLGPRSVVGERRNGATMYMFLELIEIINTELDAKFQKSTSKSYQLLLF